MRTAKKQQKEEASSLFGINKDRNRIIMGGQPITSDLDNASEKPESIEMKMQI